MQSRSSLALFLLSLVLMLGVALWFNQVLLPELREQNERLAQLEAQNQRIESTVSLLYYSADVKDQPFEAILERLEFWTERRSKSKPSVIDEDIYKEKIQRAQAAMQRLGAGIYPRLLLAYQLPENQEKSGFRLELLRMLRSIDPKKALRDYELTVRNPASPSLFRIEAARMMLDLNSERAASVLQAVLLSSSVRGARHRDAISAAASSQTFAGYDTLLGYYLRTSHVSRFETLTRILSIRDHDISTYTAVVVALNELNDKRAIPVLKELYESGAPTKKGPRNPYLMRRTIEAVARLAGKDACSWLEPLLLKEPDRAMQSVISQLISRYCPKLPNPSSGK
jgi:hypothetical protein